MTHQIEDTFNVLSIKVPEYNFVMLMDKLLGNGQKMEGGLNAEEMSVRSKLRNTTINKLGTYPAQLQVDDIHLLNLNYGDVGPFYLSEEERVLVDEIKITGY